MSEAFFTTGNRIAANEIDQDSPITETLMAKIIGRDVELSDTFVRAHGRRTSNYTVVAGPIPWTEIQDSHGYLSGNQFVLPAGGVEGWYKFTGSIYLSPTGSGISVGVRQDSVDVVPSVAYTAKMVYSFNFIAELRSATAFDVYIAGDGTILEGSSFTIEKVAP